MSPVKCIKLYGPKWQVVIQVGVQHFDVGPEWYSKGQAQWYAAQLKKCLKAIKKT